MKRGFGIRATGAVACAVVAAAAAPAWAQGPLVMGRVQGAAEFGIEASRQRNDVGPQVDIRHRKVRFLETIRLRNQSFVFDRNFLTIGSSASLGLFQDRLSVAGDRQPSNGRLTGYGVDAAILPSKRLGLNAFVNRADNTLTRRLAGSTDVSSVNRGLAVELRRTLLPSVLSYRRERIEEESVFGDVQAIRDEIAHRWSYDGQRTWDRHSLVLRYENVDVRNPGSPGLDYKNSSGSLSHRIRTGTRQPVTITSRLQRLKRRGTNGIESRSADEGISIRHSPSLTTSGQWTWSHATGGSARSTAHSIAASVRKSLYASLIADFGIRWSRSEFIAGVQRATAGRGDLQYTKSLPGSGRLGVRIAQTYERRHNPPRDIETQILGEIHVATLGVPFRLESPDADAASVTVTNTDRTAVYTPAVDYEVRVTGTFVEILPLATGRIPDGEPVAVDYRIAQPPALEVGTRSSSYSVSADFVWIEPFFRYDAADQRLRAGEPGTPLDDAISRTAGVRLRHRRGRWSGTATLERGSESSRRLAYATWRASQMVSYTPGSSLAASATLQETASSYDVPARDTGQFVARFQATWRPDPRWSAAAFAGLRSWTDTRAPDETSSEFGIRGRFRFWLSEITGALERRARMRDGSHSAELYSELKLVRSF